MSENYKEILKKVDASFAENENEAFVRYRNILNGEKVQNAEHFIFDKDEKIKSVTVFFGRP